jgi:hypothetical protein
VKGQKKEILTRQESRHSSRNNDLYFLPTAHISKQLLKKNGTFAFTTSYKANTSATLKNQFLSIAADSNKFDNTIKI